MHTHCTRHDFDSKLVARNANTNFLQKSAIYRASREWNKLAKSTRDLRSMLTLKKKI